MLFSLALAIIFAAMTLRKDNKGLIAILSVVIFVLFGVINFSAMPVLSFWGFSGVWIEITLVTLGGALFSMFDEDSDWCLDNFNLFRASPFFLVMIAFAIKCFTSAEMFNSNNYQQLLKVETVQDSTFNHEVHPIPVSKMINVNKQYAEDLASKRIEFDPSLGSRCHFGEATMINVNGSFQVKDAKGDVLNLNFENEQVWMMPLEYNGFWKWFNADYTEGYCIVSANNPEQIYFVKEVNGKPLQLKYLSSACFGEYIERHVRLKGYTGKGLADYTMEIDDNGQPMWVITTYKPQIGFSGEDATGVIIVDVQTGEVKEYSIDNAPAWVDRIQPEDMVLFQINKWGEYVKGWWNSWIGQDGVRQATPGMSMVYSDGRCFWYTGIQSVGADKSTSGFMLIDTRTKECKLYPVAGINEDAAQNIIESQSEWVRMSKFIANPPVLYNIHGVPTYYMTLTGDGTKVAGYAFVSLENELIFSAANNPQKALSSYLMAVQKGGQFQIKDGTVVKEDVQKLTVRAITFEAGIYYILFEGIKGIEFTGTTEAYSELKWTKVGDQVEVSFAKSEASKVPLDSFENTNFDF